MHCDTSPLTTEATASARGREGESGLPTTRKREGGREKKGESGLPTTRAGREGGRVRPSYNEAGREGGRDPAFLQRGEGGAERGLQRRGESLDHQIPTTRRGPSRGGAVRPILQRRRGGREGESGFFPITLFRGGDVLSFLLPFLLYKLEAGREGGRDESGTFLQRGFRREGCGESGLA